jgi:hypothetical protein
MKPKLGRKIYCIYYDGIFVDTVGFIGKESFIINNVGPHTNSDSWEWFYNQYEKDWFTSLAKAKKELLSRYKEYGDHLKVIKMNDEWYELSAE